MKIDLFGGTGFVGGNYKRMFPELTNVHGREDDIPVFKDVLYMISTTSNYNVFGDVHIDVSTNLTKMLKVLSNCKDRDIVFNFVSSWFVYGGWICRQERTLIVTLEVFIALQKSALRICW